MKKSIKYQVLEFISKNGTVSRKEIILEVFRVQGKGRDATNYSSGYYGTNIRDWVVSGVVDNSVRGKYKITTKGREYLTNPKLANLNRRLKKAEERARRYQKNYKDIWSELLITRKTLSAITHEIDKYYS